MAVKKKVNSRNKGASAEREIVNKLNAEVIALRKELGIPEFEKRDLPFQRNQNQSAVGGDDLTNPFGLSIEVKRQEKLALDTWWKQTIASANRTGGLPILIYKQNNKSWKIKMEGMIGCLTNEVNMLVEINMKDFLLWFNEYYYRYLVNKYPELSTKIRSR